MTKDETRAFEYGEQAAMRGLSRDECPYRKHDLKACWLRGWHAWHAAQPVQFGDAEKRTWSAHAEKLKQILSTGRNNRGQTTIIDEQSGAAA